MCMKNLIPQHQLNGKNTKVVFTSFKLDEIHDLASLCVNLYCVINLDEWIRVSDSTAIMGGNIWYTFWSCALFGYLAQLVL